jgi:GNAT superfamily N-acetyltransferase
MSVNEVSLPVQRLSASARAPYLAHLLALSGDDVRLRFGAPQGVSAITAYVDRIDFDADVIFAVHGDALALAGAAHLAFAGDLAELGVSVSPDVRRRGIGAALVARAAEHARNRRTQRLFMHCLAENAVMIRIAQRAGMTVVIEAGDADGHLALPPSTPMSVTSEMLADRVALYDYALKTNVETWRRMGVAMTGPSRT